MAVITQTQSPVKASRKPRPRPERRVRLYPGSPAQVEMTIGKEQFSYWLLPIASDFGTAFELRKMVGDGGTVYHVCLNGKHSTCECDGFLRWGMCSDGKGCKHIASLAQLTAEGRLAPLPSKAPVAAPSIDLDDF